MLPSSGQTLALAVCSSHTSAVFQTFEVKFLLMTLHEEGLIFLNLNFWRNNFELAENLSLVLTKLDNELGLAQPQLVLDFFQRMCSYTADLYK